MKIFILLNFIFFTVIFFEPVAFSQVNQPEQSVWKITAPNGVQGTGFFVGKNRFITNFHFISSVFHKATKDIFFDLLSNTDMYVGRVVLSQEGSSSTLNVKRVVYLSALYDLALIETEQSVPNYLKLKVKTPKSREKLVLPGYPGGVFKKITNIGTIFSHEDIHFYEIVAVSFEDLHGASGSPLLNRQGQVIGVLNAGFDGLLALIQVIKTVHLREFIKRNIGTKCGFSIQECIETEREKIVELAEKEGNPEAQYQLFQWYFSGNGDMGIKKNPELALQWLGRAAKGGYIPAQYKLYMSYSSGEKEIGIKKNPELALQWLERAAEDYAPAQYELYKHYGGEQSFKIVKKNPELALQWLEEAAKRDYAPAQYELYQHYSGKQSFKIVEKNLELALQWLEEAAKQEDPKAQYELYLYYSDEKNGKKKNPKRALKWLEKAAENEHLQAQYELYLHYSSGETAQPELALQWLKRVANQKHSQAQYDLYLYYNSEEKGRKRNPRLALKWSERLKDNTSPSGTSMFYRFAILSYEKGEFEQALGHFKTAGEQFGDIRAQYKLGMMYYKGQGTARDLKQASEHFKAAAENGDSFAQYRLAMMYHKGLGVEKNPKLALKWLEKAAQQGHPLAQSFLSKFLCQAAITEQ